MAARARLLPVFSFLARRLVFIALAVVCIPLAAWTLSGGPLETMREALASTRADQPQPSRGGGHGAAETEPRLPTPARVLGRTTRGLVGLVATVLAAVVPALAGALALTGWRVRIRRRRVMRRFWLLPYRADEATADAVEALYRAWHEQLAVRWWRR